MAGSTVTAQVPDAGTPIFDDRGYVNPVWHEFFFTLLRRTGGTEGADYGDVMVRVVILEERATDSEKNQYAVVGVSQVPDDEIPPDAYAHRTEYDPDLHALASTTAAGFMSAADKILLADAVTDVTGTLPIVSTGGQTPAISLNAATTTTPGSMSAADKLKLDAMTYVEGTWTPTLTFATPGDLSVVYATRAGTWTRIGRAVMFQFVVSTSTFTFTTASGALLVTGLPFNLTGIAQTPGKLDWQGITKAGYTEIAAVMLSGGSSIQFIASGSGQVRAVIVNGNAVSGTQVTLSCSMTIIA
jgi:hypothetical protein